MIEPQSPIARLFRYLGRYRTKLSFAISSSVINKVLDLMPPIMTGWAIDTLTQQTPRWLAQLTGSEDPWINSLWIAGIIAAVFALESLSEWLYKKAFLTLAQDAQHDLRIDAYNKMQHRELAYFENNRTGDLLAILNDDINQLERFLNDGFNQILQLVVLFVFAALSFLTISWQLTVVGMLPVPFIIWGSFYYQSRISAKYRHMRKSVGALNSRLENNISGIPVIKSFTAEPYELDRVRASSDEYRKANYDVIRFTAAYSPLIRVLITIGYGGGMVLGAWHILFRAGEITVGELTLFSMMVQRFLWPITRLGNIFDDFERAKASARRVFALMDTPNPMPEPAHPVGFERGKGEVVFEAVDFCYQPDLPLLQGLSFRVGAGQTVGIAGPTGGGKTTLIKLLLRFYDVTGGRITLDGHDLRDFRIRDLRRHIALVSQDVYLFHGTIFENIAYGIENPLSEAVWHAAQKAELHEFIMGLPLGYDTIVGERGIKLSGGQRQRLSIARAILKNAPVLVLDEATSAVDTETERAIQQNLDQLVQGKTAIIIAHRLSTIRRADKILVMKNGQIAEEGTHPELLARNGLYADLWRVQTGEAKQVGL